MQIIKHKNNPRTAKMAGCLEAAEFFAKEVFKLSKYDVKIVICFKHDLTKLFKELANCEYVDDNLIIVNIDAKVHKNYILNTLAHEMVHVKQYVKGELSSRKGLQLWKGKHVSSKLAYHETPWEIEAMRKEVLLAHAFLHASK